MSTKTKMIRVIKRNAPITIKAITSGLKVILNPVSSGSSVLEASCPLLEPAESMTGAVVLAPSVCGKDVGLTRLSIAEAVGCTMDAVLVVVIGGVEEFPACELSCMELNKLLQEVSIAFFVHESGAVSAARRLF